ncbi:hypothetical protein CERZMDRAFT_115894 [Cercospora zeae-maydis SCOH1-5]|uniref:Uncharacterized protein n=1 Tax=Cercospora zeae-maydis SCOH1-5 TaxID=717836 RepID=A0A6A6EYI2_9PEZI|nr:hypothetical protein CERZMDRAFT_115894 [Cercospora zeae-maydis SCOH1-5]
MPFGIPKGAICVQRFDDSLNSAIHITYRISLRSSSMPEPRDPLLKVLFNLLKLRRKDAVVAPEATSCVHKGLEVEPEGPHSVMIPPQVHLRRPCYDFYFL